MRRKSASNWEPMVSFHALWASTKGVITTCVYAAKDQVDFFFAENGLVAYKEGKLLATESLKTWLGEDKLKALLNFILHYVADLDIPIKRGTFIEFRNGMLNVSPIGRNCSQEERDEFERFDHGAGVRCGPLAALWRTCSSDSLHLTNSVSSTRQTFVPTCCTAGFFLKLACMLGQVLAAASFHVTCTAGSVHTGKHSSRLSRKSLATWG